MERNLHPVRNLEEAFDCYGRDNLVPITFLKQVRFYLQNCIQPVLVYPKEGDESKLTYWFLKAETQYIKKMWDATKPTKEVSNG